MRELIDAIISDKTSDVDAWQSEIERESMRKASGRDVGEDEMAEFSSEDIVKYETEKSINEVLEKYRNRGAIQDEAQEE